MPKTKSKRPNPAPALPLPPLLSAAAVLLCLVLLLEEPLGLLGTGVGWLLRLLFGGLSPLFPLLLCAGALYLNGQIPSLGADQGGPGQVKRWALFVSFVLSFPFVHMLAVQEPVSLRFLLERGEGAGLIGWLLYSLLRPLIGGLGITLFFLTAWICVLGSTFGDEIAALIKKGAVARARWRQTRRAAKANPARQEPAPQGSAPPPAQPASSACVETAHQSLDTVAPQAADAPAAADAGAGEPVATENPKGARTAQPKFALAAPSPPLEGDTLPPIELLSLPDPQEEDRERVAWQAKKIVETLNNFGVECRIGQVRTGPRVTRFEVLPAAGVKVREITQLADDLSLHLAASPLRVEAPIPGKSAVGIEVPNRHRATVALRELIEDLPPAAENQGRLVFALGKNVAGARKVADLCKMPHLLIAGATGSGKSVCINAVLASLLFKATPRDVRLVLIDPKRVELTLYHDIPHLVAPVITDARKAAKVLEVVLQEMEERYQIFSEMGVRNIQSYNDKKREDRLPYLVIIIDELADLMLQSSADVERNICRIAQLSRATGIHLVIATQRPSVNVITGLIKANIPSRIAFAVASQTDSRVILDTGGAEKLLGEGDMLYLPIEESKPTRLQGAFISEEEAKSLADFWRSKGSPDYDSRFTDIEVGEEEGERVSLASSDELLPQAVEVILTTKQASASLLQRKMKIGYARAGRLMDELEKQGIVGPQDGAKPREILLNEEALYQIARTARRPVPTGRSLA